MAWGDFLNNIDWNGIIQRAVPAVIDYSMASGANRGAAQQVAQSQNAAALQVAQAEQAAAAQRQAALDQAVQQRQQALQTAQSTLQPTLTTTQPALGYLRTVMADQSLTPLQQQQIANTRMQTANMLASRLGGRSATAVATRAANNLQNSIYEANRQRSLNAANTLAGYGQGATTNLANAALNAGNLNAAGTTNTGNLAATGTEKAGAAQAGGTITAGNTAAQAGLATGQVAQQSVGNVWSPSVLDAIRSFSANDRKSPYSTAPRVGV